MQAAQAADLPAIALTLANAFVDDPMIAVLFGGNVAPGPARRFFEIMGKIQLPHGMVFTTPGREAAAIWAPPGAWKVPNTQIVKNTPALMRVFGRRLFANVGVLSLLEKNHPPEPHYYLEFIGTDPAHQGKGLGGALIRPIVERCDAEGVGAYLESSKESNLAFYARFGFETTKVLTHKAGVAQWLMWRDPK